MQFKKELCRNFQRGSCQYGERCKFLHASQQQPKSKAIGFGTQAASQQQNHQKPNPFGFGVQSNPQSKGPNNFGSKQNQFKPFENKWSRFSPIPTSGAPSSSRQPDNQSQSINHKCTDPESCKRIISEDLEHERPLWKLTCYSHWKNAPCDIVGDVSSEELRAAAYDDAKRGLNLQSIVERERNLLNSKLIEFDNLLRNPYMGPVNPGSSSQTQFLVAAQSEHSSTPQNNAPPSVSSFSQLGSSVNMGFGTRLSAPVNNAFGQPTNNSYSSQTSSIFGTKYLLSPSTSIAMNGQTSSIFGTNNILSASTGPFGTQLPAESVSSSFSSNVTSFGNSGVTGARSNKYSNPSLSANNPSPLSFVNPTVLSGAPVLSSNAAEQASVNVQLMNNLQSESVTGDSSVWLKEKWIPGEIPEIAPPDAFCIE
ncbi:zinc finger CCCH domain-containing protein 16 isoform X2 [Mangifera indica]|uniref:zinc finger CCCH domain-containing protein 16 isoform X2 n=1 Tax=Mangifera indica TaxID=29780 RepID=UPI001CFAACD3|nr:zinc finger CCCH domain-containing protein 16 isoform X2 [Mangifera indica]